MEKLNLVRQAQLKKSDVLVLNIDNPLDNQVRCRKKEKIRLKVSLEKSLRHGKRVIIYCPPIGLAQEILETVGNLGVPYGVSRTIHLINKIYKAPQTLDPQYSTIKSTNSNNYQVMLVPLNTLKKSSNHNTTSLESFYLYNKHISATFAENEKSFYFPRLSNMQQLHQVIESVAPKELYLTGAYAKTVLDKVKYDVPVKKCVFPYNQESLF